MCKFCSKICFQYKGWYSLSFINWNLSKTQHDADWLGIIAQLICNHCPKQDLFIMYSYSKSLAPKQLGVQHQNCKKIEKIKDIVETVRCPFWALDIWTLGLMKDLWQTHEVLPHQKIIKGHEEDQRYPFCTPLKVLLKAFHGKKGNGKDSIRNMLRLEDKPRT